MLQLHADWKSILKRAWSVRWMLLVAFFSAAEVIVPLYFDSLPRNLFAALSGVSVAGALISRIIVQNNLDG